MILRILLCMAAPALAQVHIATDTYEGAEHFVVRTPAATYWYDRAGGGFSRLIDRDGRDWIGFRREPWNEFPASAASSYRGLPNFVFAAPEAGAGHPGFTQCTSDRDGDSIVTQSKSGAWRWRWTFFADHARVTMERAGPDAYWFLYEGTPGGVYEPDEWYWGHNGAGPMQKMPDFVRGERVLGHFEWVFFGHSRTARVLFLARGEPDESLDSFGVMGNTRAGLASPDGMTVFGFGRAKEAKPLLRGAPRTFIIGFHEQAVRNDASRRTLAERIRTLLSGTLREGGNRERAAKAKYRQ